MDRSWIDVGGIGIHILVKQLAPGRDLDIDTHTRNALLRSLRCLGERGFPLLTGGWRTRYPYHCSPGKIGDIVAPHSSLPIFEYGYIKVAGITSLSGRKAGSRRHPLRCEL